MPGRLFVVCASTLIAVAAHATDPAAKRGHVLSIGGGKSGGKLLTRDQLRHCLASQKKLEQQDAELGRAQAALDADKADIARLDTQLAPQTNALQPERANAAVGDGAGLPDHDTRLAQRAEREAQRNHKVDAYNAKLAPFNAQVQALNQARQIWQTGCADRPYDEADWLAIQRGK